jgi:hypothetical protein
MRRRRPAVWWILLGLGGMLVFGTAACENDNDPSSTDVSLSGIVRESGTNAVVAGATVTVQNKSATTGTDGRYLIEDLAAGNASVQVGHQGHQNLTQSVTLSGETTGNFTISRATIAGYIGNWTGGWTNNAGFSGSATMTFNANTVAQTFEAVVDLNGSVFGLLDPPAQTVAGPYNPGGNTTSIIATSLGTLSVTFSATGQISGSLTGVVAGGISRMDFTGTSTSSTININYTVTFIAGPPVTGTLTLTK